MACAYVVIPKSEVYPTAGCCTRAKAAAEKEAGRKEKAEKKKAKPAAKKKTTRKTTRTTKVASGPMRLVWVVCDHTGSSVKTYPYKERDDAHAEAARLTTDKGKQHFVKNEKVPLE